MTEERFRIPWRTRHLALAPILGSALQTDMECPDYMSQFELESGLFSTWAFTRISIGLTGSDSEHGAVDSGAFDGPTS